MNYLIVCKSDNKHFLLTSDDSAITAFRDKKAVMAAFKGYTDAWTRNYESSMSACIGMMNMQPVAIEAPEKAEDLLPYIIEHKIYHITGGAMRGGYKGVPVKEDILRLEQFNIWNETMIDAGIKSPDDKQLKLFNI